MTNPYISSDTTQPIESKILFPFYALFFYAGMILIDEFFSLLIYPNYEIKFLSFVTFLVVLSPPFLLAILPALIIRLKTKSDFKQCYYVSLKWLFIAFGVLTALYNVYRLFIDILGVNG